MGEKISIPKTFMGHPNQWKLRNLLQELFADPDTDQITKEITRFLKKHPIPIDDFPQLKGIYTRTMLFKSQNGFEAMAARWSSGAISSIHGHPSFTLYFVSQGKLLIDNYKKDGAGRVKKIKSGFLTGSEFLSFTGQTGTLDNHIHQVKAVQDTLSIHVSSDDATKGKIFS